MKYDKCQNRVKALGTRGGTPNQVRLGRWDRNSCQWEVNPNPKEEQDPDKEDLGGQYSRGNSLQKASWHEL